MSGPSPGPAVPFPTIAPADLRLLLAAGRGGFFVIDTRSRADYEAGHVPGALHCPVHELSHRRNELPPEHCTVFVVGEAGARGRASAVFFVLAGYGGVALLEGGFAAWEGEKETGPGLPLASSRPAKPAGWVDPPSRKAKDPPPRDESGRGSGPAA